MKCTISDCNAQHRIFVRLPGQEKPKPFCGPHALEMQSRFSRVVPESETLAPVIDINTRKRIASWSERYSSGIGQTINQLSQMIWPEGPKTMMSDVATVTKILTDPVKREQAVQKIKHPIQTMSHGAQMTIHNLKTKLMGPTEEKPVVNEGPDPNKINDNNYMRWYHDTLPKVANIAWNERYATAVRPDKCRLCGQSDDGTRTVVSNGTCKDTQDCAETQEGLANRTLTVLEPVKKPRKQPIVDRKGTSSCTHPDCLKAGKRYPVENLSWDKSPMGNPVCRDHWRPGTTDYNSWRGEYKRR